MHKNKKIIFIVLGIIIFLGLINLGFTVWVESKLPKLINNENNTDYNISYKDIDLSIWNAKITAYDVSISPKKNLKESDKKFGLYGNIDLIEVTNFDIWSILFDKKIKAKSLVVSNPRIILFKNNDSAINDYNNINSKVFKPFERIIIVSNLFMERGKFKIFNTLNQKTLANIQNINFKLEGIVLNEKTLNEEIPISYNKYTLTCDSVFYQVNEFYDIKSSKIVVTEKSLKIKKFKFLPKYTRRNFIQKIRKEKDLFTILADDISIKKMAWGFKNKVFFFDTNSIVLNNVAANIYRGKMPSDDLSKKELYNRLLRNLKVDIKVDSLFIKNSLLTYEEEKTFEKGPSKLFFSNFNLFAQSIESGYNKTKLPDVRIKINCNFMKESPLKVDWSFNVLNKKDGFKIVGSIDKFNAEELAVFTKPYMNIKVNGEFDEVYFDFSGNDILNKGTFSLKYDDLKVVIYQNNKRLKKNKFLSTIGNLFVKNDSDDEIKTTEIEVERNQEKSFYNFLWISIADGLKKILL
ncbi:hypothetical protein [uncultured Flavobacterium sp.]|uniref:hypothetical protein n=1 Tax=uncultured Flavobacterium sp. TaxID=165435 RepID=UPI0030ED631D